MEKNKDFSQEKIKASLDRLNPSEEQTLKMWARIEAARTVEQVGAASEATVGREFAASRKGTDGNRETSSAKKWAPWKTVLAAVLALALLSGSYMTAEAVTGGAISQKIISVLGLNTHDDIVDQAVNAQSQGSDIYAPDILYIDSDYLVFGNLRGIMVFSKQTGSLIGTIDSQAIDCMYFNSDSKETCVTRDGDRLWVFNEEDGEICSSLYAYEPENADAFDEDGSLTLQEESEDKVLLKECGKLQDTFQKFNDADEVSEYFEKSLSGQAMYSQSSYQWTDAEGRTRISFLVVEDDTYYLFDYNEESGTFENTQLDFGALTGDTSNSAGGSEDGMAQEIPVFTYTGDDPEIAAIIAYLAEEEAEYSQEDIWIPEFVIYGEFEKGGESLVFGNFWSGQYQVNGDILECISDGEMPACFHLKEESDGSYSVVSYDRAGDGADYEKSIKDMTKGYPEIREKMLAGDETERTEARENFLRMYVEESGLDVSYYKDYGWDPVELEP